MDNWSVYVVDGFDSAQPSGDRIQPSGDRIQPSGDRIQSFSDRSLSGVEGNTLSKNNLDERQK